MRTRHATVFAGMALSLILTVNGIGQETRQGPLTDAIKNDDDLKTKEAFTKLEEIRRKVINAKPGEGLWETGRQAFPHLQVLADRWDDPRSEEILKQLAASGPKKIEGELEMQTLAYAADRYLIQLQDNREYDGLLQAIDKPDDRVKKIREYFDAHPELLKTKCYGRPNRPIVRMLLDEAEKLKGAEVIDLLVCSQLYGSGHFAKYGDALLDYAKKLGRAKAVATPYLLQYLAITGNTNAVPMLEGWFKEEPDGKVMDMLCKFPDAKSRLLTWLKDSRPGVARNAACWLALVAADNDSLNAVNELINQLRKSGAPKDEISFFEGAAKSIRQMMAGGTHAP